jgi:hypothetical protein
VRIVSAISIALAACCASGCMVVSLQPFYEPNSILFDAALIGTWRSEDDKATITVKRGEWKSYDIVYADETFNEALTGYLTAVANRRIIDVTPQRGRDQGPFLIPVHSVFQIEIDADTLKLSGLNFDWFDSARTSPSFSALRPATDARMNVVLTAPTTALRVWLASHIKPDQTFSPPASFTRQTTP